MTTRIPGFLPRELRELVRFVPRRGWDVVDWKPLLASLRQVAWRYLSDNGVEALSASTARVCQRPLLTRSLQGATALAAVDDPASLRRYGDDILRLYFAQWLVSDGLFIDLRSTRFGVIDSQLAYAPSGLWVKLRPEFRGGMLALYRSFYSDDEGAFDAALRQMGLLKAGLEPAAQAELKTLLNSHFGIDQRVQRFSIDGFKASFDALFAFFTAHDYKLHSDFVWVGFYLITLYLTLEQGGEAHDTRAICAEVLLGPNVAPAQPGPGLA